jgi:hypothetical protein
MSQRDLLSPEEQQMIPSSEEILYTTKCSIRGRRKEDPNFVGCIVVTAKTVHLLKRQIAVFGNKPLTKESMPISQITGVDQTFERYLTVQSHHVRITRANNEDVLYGLGEAAARKIVETINAQTSQSGSAPSSASIDPIEQLTKLAALLEKGLVTQQEFDDKKRQLLSN